MAEVVLIADASPMSSVICTMLKGEGFSVAHVSETAKVQDQLKAKECRLVICDTGSAAAKAGLVFTMLSGEHAGLARILLCNPDEQMPVSSSNTPITAVMPKPLKIDALVDRVFKMIDEAELLKAGDGVAAALKLQRSSDAIIGNSAATKELRQQVEKIAPGNMWVLIHGDKGTDKEMVVRTLHACSTRAAKPYTSISCAGQDPATLETFLFGSKELQLPGLLENTAGGTFFLNDIDALPMEDQERLHKVVSSKPVGDPTKTITGVRAGLDVRLVVGGTRQPQLLLEQKLLHPLLAAALSGAVISLKPLRECKEDVMPLVAYYLQQACGAGQPVPTLDEEVAAAFQKYYWPGNAQEVDNVLRTMVANLPGGDRISKDTLPAHIAAIARMRT